MQNWDPDWAASFPNRPSPDHSVGDRVRTAVYLAAPNLSFAEAF